MRRLLPILIGLLLAACAADGAPSDSVGATAAASPPAAVTILVDTDVAADDLVALSFLLSAPNVQLAAITVSGTGEAHCDGGVATVLGLLERLQAPSIPVACGRETPLTGDQAFPDAWRAHADSGSGLELPHTDRTAYGTAVELIGRVASDNEALIVLTLGPMTNLADVLRTDPGVAGRIAAVYVMGGAVAVGGNAPASDSGFPVDGAAAEWNIYVDPQAAQVVIDAGLAPSLVSLDGTNQVPVTTEYAARVRARASAPAALVLADLFAANEYMADGGYYLWDPLAAELAAGYPVGDFTDIRIAVEVTDPTTWGATMAVDGDANASYLTDVNPSAAEDTLLDVLNGT